MWKNDPPRVVRGEGAAKYQTNNFLVFVSKREEVFNSATPLKHSDVKQVHVMFRLSHTVFGLYTLGLLEG